MDKIGHKRLTSILDYGINRFVVYKSQQSDGDIIPGSGNKTPPTKTDTQTKALFPNRTYSTLYSLSYNMSSQAENYNDQLYTSHQRVIEDYLKGDTVEGRLKRREHDGEFCGRGKTHAARWAEAP